MKTLSGTLSKIILLGIISMLLIALVPMCFQYRALMGMRSTISRMDGFDRYFGILEDLDEALGDYLASESDEGRQTAEALMAELIDAGWQMTEAFPHPRFVDNAFLTESCMEKAEAALDMAGSQSWEERITSFLEYRRVRDFILDNQPVLAKLRSELVMKDYEGQFLSWRVQFSALLALVLAASIILLLSASRLVSRLLKPLQDLTESIKAYRPGEGQVSLEDGGSLQETQILSSAFTGLVGQLEKKLETDRRNRELQAALSETRMQLVESMISPHFLFNCLATLSSLAYFEEAPRTRSLSLLIAGYLRDCLSLVGHSIPLEKELEHTRNYLSIQKERFQDRLEFRITDDGLSDSFEVPSMIIQPLCENAISHGLKDKLSGGLVAITVSSFEDGVTIAVRDNGNGLENEALEKLRASIAEPFEAGKGHVGLHSVASRLRGTGTVSLDSSPGEYFEVTLDLKRQPIGCTSGRR